MQSDNLYKNAWYSNEGEEGGNKEDTKNMCWEILVEPLSDCVVCIL